MRLIHAVRDLNAATRQTGGHQIEVIALHTEGEKRAMFVREADVAYDLGPAANRPYLDHALLERALTQTRADAAWVGWGFVAEDAAFADLCARIGVAFIGPSGEAMRNPLHRAFNCRRGKNLQKCGFPCMIGNVTAG